MNESLSAEGERNCTELDVFMKKKKKHDIPEQWRATTALEKQNILILIQEERKREIRRARERMLSVITFLKSETRIRKERKREQRDRWHLPLASRQRKTSVHEENWIATPDYEIVGSPVEPAVVRRRWVVCKSLASCRARWCCASNCADSSA